jgi:hypothetical protein
MKCSILSDVPGKENFKSGLFTGKTLGHFGHQAMGIIPPRQAQAIKK